MVEESSNSFLRVSVGVREIEKDGLMVRHRIWALAHKGLESGSEIQVI
jgi:hypothetical protein